VSGRYFMRNMPKSNVVVVILVVLSLLSALMYYVQLQNYLETKKYLLNAVLNNLGPNNGGSEYTADLFKELSCKYNDNVRTVAANKGGSATKRNHRDNAGPVPKSRMLEDPEFTKLAKEFIDDIKIQGSSRKPEFNDILLVWLFTLPLRLLGQSKKSDEDAVDIKYYESADSK
jgi:hypothetical protein